MYQFTRINNDSTVITVGIGERWTLSSSTKDLQTGQLSLEPALLTLFTSSQAEVQVWLATPQGQVKLEYNPYQGRLTGQALTGLVGQAGELVLECLSNNPLSFQLSKVLPPNLTLPTGQLNTAEGIPISFSSTDATLLQTGLTNYVPLEHFRLSLQAAQFGLVAGFDTLRCLPLLHEVELLEHQLRTTRMVLNQLRGRALLGDEVGLGKTIEAGMILLELVMRGLTRRTLILTPPSLVEQWQTELSHKFGLASISYDDPLFKQSGSNAWQEHERIIVSYHTAKREPHRAAILKQEWDMVIIDEAHHFRNRQTALWQMAAALKKRYMLLLTATPVQNSLEDLFNLVGLLQPELLSTSRSFQRQFIDRKDKLTPRNVEELHARLREVMVRNRRATVGRKLPHRLVRTETVQPSEIERQLYEGVSELVRTRLRETKGTSRAHLTRMSLLTMQRALGSSAQAALPMLERLSQDTNLPSEEQQRLTELVTIARQLEKQTKLERLLAIVQKAPDKVVIFSQFRETQALLYKHLTAAGEQVVAFHGGLSRLQKEEAIRQFQGSARVLLSTDAGSEGRNLQFCNVICNYDLPWNPMRIEQRIGRLSRIGQTRDVYVYNLVAANTIEAALLYLLDAKIAMFELVIGEIDMILGNVDEEKEFEELVTDLWVENKDRAAFHKALDQLGERLVVARESYFRQRAQEDRLFGESLAPEV